MCTLMNEPFISKGELDNFLNDLPNERLQFGGTMSVQDMTRKQPAQDPAFLRTYSTPIKGSRQRCRSAECYSKLDKEMAPRIVPNRSFNDTAIMMPVSNDADHASDGEPDMCLRTCSSRVPGDRFGRAHTTGAQDFCTAETEVVGLKARPDPTGEEVPALFVSPRAVRPRVGSPSLLRDRLQEAKAEDEEVEKVQHLIGSNKERFAAMMKPGKRRSCIPSATVVTQHKGAPGSPSPKGPILLAPMQSPRATTPTAGSPSTFPTTSPRSAKLRFRTTRSGSPTKPGSPSTTSSSRTSSPHGKASSPRTGSPRKTRSGSPQQARSSSPNRAGNSPKLQPAGKRNLGGNQEHATAIEQRSANFKDDSLRQVMEDIWKGLPLENDKLTKRGYKMLYRCLYWKVVPEGSKKECDDLAEVEWDVESKGEEYMDWEQFYNSMFMFVDIWCTGLSKEKYVNFAKELLLPIVSDVRTTQVQPFNLSTAPKTQVRRPNLKAPEVEIMESQARIAWLSANPVAAVDVYRSECQRCAVPVSQKVVDALPDRSKVPPNAIKTLVAASAGLNTLVPLIDVLLLNRDIEELILRDNNLDSDSFELLFTVLLWLRKLRVLDISENPPMSLRAVHAFHQLLCRNTKLSRVRSLKTVSKCYEFHIRAQVEANFHSRVIARDDYFLLQKAFHSLDTSHSGLVDLQELLNWCAVAHLRGRKLGGASGANQQSQAIARLHFRAQKVAQKLKTDSEATGVVETACAFHQVLQFLYPTVPLQVIHHYIEHYEASDDPVTRRKMSNDKIVEIFRRYDRNHDGLLTMQELQEGLCSEGLNETWDKYKGDIQRYDFNGDSRLSLDEFIMWMSLVDGCEF